MGEKPTGIQKALRRAEQLWPDANAYVALAFHTGVSAQVIYKWEAIGGIPTTRHALKVSELTGVAVSELAPAIEAAKPKAGPPGGHRTKRAFQKKAPMLSVVEGVDGGMPTVRERAAVEARGELRVPMVEGALDVLKGFAAAQQRRRKCVTQAVNGQPFRKTG
jgi:hypothetical protein